MLVNPGYFFIVNDDVVIAHCPTAAIAATTSCFLVMPHKYYKATVSVQEVYGVRVTASCSSCADTDQRAIASVKAYLSEKLAPKAHYIGTSGLIGYLFDYQQQGDTSRQYKVFRCNGGGISAEGCGDLLECIESSNNLELESWQYFTARKVTLYESQVREAIASVGVAAN